MAGIPRLLPLVAVAIGGVLAVNAVRGAPQLLGAAKSFAEDVVTPRGAAKPPAVSATASLLSPAGSDAAKAPAPVCAPTASELAKEAGLSPAELQVLQSLGSRRGELDQREQGLDTQVQLIAAAEAKLDERIKDMNGLKANIQDLLGQVDAQQQAETDRLIAVYEKMKPQDAAARITLMDDSVRLPMAAKMKPAKLADILAKMPAEDAKNLTEKLASRVNGAKAVADARNTLNPPPAAAPAPPKAQAANADSSAPAADAKPVKTAKAKPKAKPKAPKSAVAANDKSPPAIAGAAPASASGSGAPAAAGPTPAKSG
jgi:flagellar motility protein MotE (MotC chaperone)